VITITASEWAVDDCIQLLDYREFRMFTMACIDRQREIDDEKRRKWEERRSTVKQRQQLKLQRKLQKRQQKLEKQQTDD